MKIDKFLNQNKASETELYDLAFGILMKTLARVLYSLPPLKRQTARKKALKKKVKKKAKGRKIKRVVREEASSDSSSVDSLGSSSVEGSSSESPKKKKDSEDGILPLPSMLFWQY